MEARLLQKAVRLAVGPGRPPPGRGLHTTARPPGPASFFSRIVRSILPRSAAAPAPVQGVQPFAFRGVHTRPALSFPARNFLAQSASKSRPLHHLPRPPSVTRGVHQVGLGAARNFSSARPVLQSLVENVPIALRAFSEADVDVRKGKNGAVGKKGVRTTKKSSGGKVAREMNKRRADYLPSFTSSFEATTAEPAELSHYFPTSSTAITHVILPFSPPSTPLASSTSSTSLHEDDPFLSLLAQTHATHATHSARITSLLGRLPPALRSETFAGLSGQAEWLRLTYAASADEVRAWLGEAGRWADVVEEREPDTEREFVWEMEMERVREEERQPLPFPALSLEHELVFPELDFSFSADFLDRLPSNAAHEPVSTWPTPQSTGPASPSYADADNEDDEDVLSEPDSQFSFMEGSDREWVAFSSEFSARRDEVLNGR